jgi:hypothetical protein
MLIGIGTPPVPGARKDLLDGLPEAERAIADGEVGRDLQPTLLVDDTSIASFITPRSAQSMANPTVFKEAAERSEKRGRQRRGAKP